MRRSLRSLLAPLVLTLATVACGTVPEPMLPEITFQHLPPLQLNVARVEIIDGVREPLRAPHVGHLLPTPPRTALHTWANDRLTAVGATGTARFIIIDADVTETALPRKKGLSGAFTDEQSDRYDAKVTARLEIIGLPNLRTAEAMANAIRSQTIAESATVNQRDRLGFDLIDNLMRSFNTEMENNIRKHLAVVLK